MFCLSALNFIGRQMCTSVPPFWLQLASGNRRLSRNQRKQPGPTHSITARAVCDSKMTGGPVQSLHSTSCAPVNRLHLNSLHRLAMLPVSYTCTQRYCKFIYWYLDKIYLFISVSVSLSLFLTELPQYNS